MRPAYQAFVIVAVGFLLFGLQSTSGLSAAAIVGTVLALPSLLLIRNLDPSGRMRLGEIFLLALMLRWAAAALAFLVINDKYPGFIAPDEIFYDSAGAYYAEFLAGHVPNPYPDTWPGGVLITSGTLYWIFGFAPMVTRFVNGFVGAWTAVLAGLIGKQLYDEAVGRRAAFIAAVTPSLITWACVNTKDAATLMGGELGVLAFMLLRNKFRFSYMVVFALSLLYVAAYRPYEIVFIGVAAIAGVTFTDRGNLFRNVVVGVGLTMVVAALVRATGATEVTAQQDVGTFDTIAQLREGYASGAGSAVNLTLVDTSTPVGLVMWVPVGLFYFYFAPIPFSGGSLASLATSPEMLLLYYLVPSILRGLRQSLRERFQTTMPLLVFVLASSVGWSMVVTNVGTLYRYRSQVLFVFIIFMAADMVRRAREARAPRALDPFLQTVLQAREARARRLATASAASASSDRLFPSSGGAVLAIDPPDPGPFPAPNPAGR